MDMRRRRPGFPRPQAIPDYYATRGIKKEKKDCRGKFLQKEQYMKVITYS